MSNYLSKLTKTYYILVVLTVAVTIISFFNIIVYPTFNLSPFILACATLAVRTINNYKKGRSLLGHLINSIFIPLIIFIIIVAICALMHMINPRDGHREYSSPNDVNVVILEEDITESVSLYKKHNFLFMSKIDIDGMYYISDGNHWEIVWLSDWDFELRSGYQTYLIDLRTGSVDEK